MKTPTSGPQLPPAMLQKLREIRRQDGRVRLWTGVLRGLAILLAAMLVAMTIDWMVVLYGPGSRWALTLSALAFAAAGASVALCVAAALPVLLRLRPRREA